MSILSESTRTNLMTIIGNDKAVDAVESACRRFIRMREDLSGRSSAGTVNKKLLELNSHLLAISEILGDRAVGEKISLLIQEHRYFELARDLPEMKRTVVKLSRLTDEVEKLKPGRPTGDRDRALWHLGVSFYEICEKSGIEVKKSNPKGKTDSVLHKILDEIREPLGIGAGEANGIFNNVIEEIKNHPQHIGITL